MTPRVRGLARVNRPEKLSFVRVRPARRVSGSRRGFQNRGAFTGLDLRWLGAPGDEARVRYRQDGLTRGFARRRSLRGHPRRVS